MPRVAVTASTVVVLTSVLIGIALIGNGNAGWTGPAPAEWPQYRADAERSGFVDDRFDANLSLQWSYQMAQPPSPAWRGEDTRMPFDQVYQPVVISRGLLYFGSSSEDCVVALHSGSGTEQWRYFTDAPVRFAPALWKDRLFVVSDDGALHVLNADTGALVRRVDLTPKRDMVLGNGRMISRWPARGGPVVREGVVYFGVGIWPSEGITICALDADTLEPIWRNDNSGGLEWDQPHPGARAESGISAQGYLFAAEDQLLVPTGRGVPAALNRADGSLSYFHLQLYGKPFGGASIMAIEDFFFNGGQLFAEDTGLSAGATLDRNLMVATSDRAICSDGSRLQAVAWAETQMTDRRGEPVVTREVYPAPLGPERSDLSVDGAIAGALELNGAGEHLITSTPWQGSPQSFAAWVKIPRDIPDGQRIGIIAGNYPDTVSLNWEGYTNGRPRIYWNRGEVDWSPEVDLRTGEWLHYAFVRDPEKKQFVFYLNGSPVATHDEIGSEITVDATFHVGADKRGAKGIWFGGGLDDVRVYGRPLAPEEVAALANREAPDAMPVEGLIAHLPLDEHPVRPGGTVLDAAHADARATIASQATADAPHPVSGMIGVGDTLIIGGPNVVSALDLEPSEPRVCWQAPVEGDASGLAWAAGQLFVSTTGGRIYCFGPGNVDEPRVVSPTGGPSPYDREAAGAAMEIIRKSAVTSGYAIDLGCGDGRLAEELARRTDLQVIGIEADPAKVAAARARLCAAGLYGTRVTIHQGDPARTPYPNYCADLVVSSRALRSGPDAVARAEMMRLLHPWGGMAVIGSPTQMQLVERGGLEDAGSWTHQYADAANTLTSADQRVRRPLGMLWFTDFSDMRLTNRHGRAPAPLFAEGVMFVLGKDGLNALNAYNGSVLWRYELPEILTPYDQEHLLGTAVTGSPFCYGQDSVYVRYKDYAVRLDRETGRELGRFTAPEAADGGPGTWGFIATDGGILFGSVANEQHVTMWAWSRPSEMEGMPGESEAIFALDATTGERLWSYRAANSIRHNAIAIGGGRVYLIDRPLAQDDLLERQTSNAGRLSLTGEPAGHPFGVLVALDARTGEVVWRAQEEIFGTMLALSTEHDTLVMSYQHNHSFRLRSEIGGRMAGYRASTGERLWALEGINQRSRIMLNDDTIYTQGGAWKLATGEAVPFEFSRTYGCGTLAAARNMLVFRSGTLGYRDLSTERTENYGGIRPGCWINAIPAGGLVLMPDATHACTCSYLNKAHIALQPMAEAQQAQ